SATSKETFGRSPASVRARSIIASDRSTPTARSTISATRRTPAPVPHPTSSSRSAAVSRNPLRACCCSPASHRETGSSSYRLAHRSNRRLASVTATPSRIRPSEAASVVPAVVHLPRPGLSDRSQLVPPRPELLQVVGVRLESVHPLVEPRVESFRLPSDLIPREVEGVVTVVIALDV